MKRLLCCLALVASLLVAGDSVSIPVRGKPQALVRIPSTGSSASKAVIFLPGDGGWRGAAVKIGNTIASWGYDVYGFDTKKYLEASSSDGAMLSRDELGSDMRGLAEQVATFAKKPVLLVGWSQGAGMAIAAIACAPNRNALPGLVTLGLPESSVLGWDWQATLAVLSRREPALPSFAVTPLLPHLAPARIWMIYGSKDEYTQPENEHAMFRAASEPKRFQEIAGANHRFDGHQDELFRSLREGLKWIGHE